MTTPPTCPPSVRLIPWAELAAQSPQPDWIDVRGALIDSALTPIWDETLCVDALYFNVTKFLKSPGEGSAMFRGATLADGTLRLAQPPEPVRRLPGRTILVGSVDNFGHHILHHLPRLTAALDLGLVGDRYLIGPAVDFALGFFDVLGIPRDQVVSIGPDETVWCDHLTILPMLCHVGDMKGSLTMAPEFPAAMLRRLRRLSPPRLRLYLPRGEARWRRLVNEDAIIAALKSKGFTIYSAAGRPMAEQLAVIGAAETVVAPGGAGFALTNFAAPGTKLFELRHQGGTLFGGWGDLPTHLAGLNHYKVEGSAVSQPGQRVIDADFRVDPDYLLSFLERPITPAGRVTRVTAGVRGATRATPVAMRTPSWSEMTAAQPGAGAVRVRDVLVDRTLSPMLNDVVCVDRMVMEGRRWWRGLEGAIYSGAGYPPGQVLLPQRPVPTLRVRGHAAVIGSAAQASVFIAQSLPRLALALGLRDPPQGLIVDQVSPLAHAFFRLAGLADASLVALDAAAVAQVEAATLIPVPWGYGLDGVWFHSLNGLHALRRRFGRFGPESTGPRRRLLVGADRSPQLDALAADRAATPLGWSDATTPERLTEMLALLGEAGEVIAVDAAGMAAAQFAPAGALIERLGVSEPPRWFAQAAGRFGWRWRRPNGDTIVTPSLTQRTPLEDATE